MYDPEMRKDCPMRGNLGNCSPVGGFCMDAVSDEICEALHNAYDQGFYNALKTLKAQEPQSVIVREKQKNGNILWFADCPKCKHGIERDKHKRFCGYCGQEVKWDD